MTDKILECEIDTLKVSSSYWTAREIAQQPDVWLEAEELINSQQGEIDQWLSPRLSKPGLRVILSGAGTSSFAGEILAPWLAQQMNRRVDAISTTDIVGDPAKYLAEDVPTLMVSFARSGDSPESVASINLASQELTDCSHLFLTCNPDGHLAKQAEHDPNSLCLLMPDRSNDRGFAMTSSFTSMLISCAAIFLPEQTQVSQAAGASQAVIDNHLATARRLAELKYRRLVILGTGNLLGTAREITLKVLELTAGQIAPFFDTPLGFRHGPKSTLDDDTLVIHLASLNPHSRLYDRDLLAELHRDFSSDRIVELSPQYLGIESAGDLDEFWILFPYLVFCQMFAFFSALAFEITADNPCPTGEVNRVVQGVTIHEYQSENSHNGVEKVAGIRR